MLFITRKTCDFDTSQAELAKRSGIGERTIQRYEKDASTVSLSILTQLADFLDADFLWLVYGDDISKVIGLKISKIFIRAALLLRNFKI